MSLKKELLSSSRRVKQFLVAANDLVCFLIGIILATLLSDIALSKITPPGFISLLFLPFLSVFIFYLFGIYKSVLRYIDFAVIYQLFKAIIAVFVINLGIKYFYIFFLTSFFDISFSGLITITGWIVGLLSSIVLVVGSRIFANYLFSTKRSEKKVVIYGAGSAGIQLASALRVSSEMQPIAFVDKDRSLHNTYLGDLKVLGPDKLRKMVLRNNVDEVLIAIPSASKAKLNRLLQEIEDLSVKVRILPGLAELAQGKVLVSELKEVDTSDLLGRMEVEANQELLDRNIKNKNVLITGAGGSIGSEITRQVARLGAREIIILDSNEFCLYEIKKEIEILNLKAGLHAVLANVTNKKRVKRICEAFNVDTIYHTAAVKHVPIVEENVSEGVSNNILGTLSCAEAAIEAKVETFVLISTDKAVRPTNIMGATKRFSEMILQSFSEDEEISKNTRMTMVRFGNVLGSSGSAVPLFQQQIRSGGPVTVTHPKVVRYFMSIPEAAELVIQAGAMGKGGDVFVLDMGDPVNISDLAKRLVNLSGLELKDDVNPDGDIEIIYTGLRPGEKLYEELLIGSNVNQTEHNQILRAQEQFLPKEDLNRFIGLLKQAQIEDNIPALKDILKESVQGYTPERDIVDVVQVQKEINSKS